MLQRSSQVGEFYRMAPPPVPKTTDGKMVPEYMGKPRHAPPCTFLAFDTPWWSLS